MKIDEIIKKIKFDMFDVITCLTVEIKKNTKYYVHVSVRGRKTKYL